ncbi:MAG TPA: RNase adapter RapZ [Flavilitoribacter sp.]|nr:RNase adapter RapZ [Flavilitoribacter sp.]
MVNFGCTGGQHRSVYAADELAKHLKEKYGVRISLQHIEQERKGWEN